MGINSMPLGCDRDCLYCRPHPSLPWLYQWPIDYNGQLTTIWPTAKQLIPPTLPRSWVSPMFFSNLAGLGGVCFVERQKNIPWPRFCASRVLHSGVTFLDLATQIGHHILQNMEVDYSSGWPSGIMSFPCSPKWCFEIWCWLLLIDFGIEY